VYNKNTEKREAKILDKKQKDAHLLSPNCPGFLPNLARKLSSVRDTNTNLGSSAGISRS